MDKKLMAICVLTVTAVALMLANFSSRPAQAQVVLSGRNYQIATGHLATGGEGVYILDNVSGNIAIFSYSPEFKQLKVRDAISAATAVGGQPGTR